jgi:hypothetical protein
MAAPKGTSLEQMVAAGLEFAAVHGRPPTTTDFARADGDRPPAMTISGRFGGWGNYLLALGLPKRAAEKAPVTRETALAALRAEAVDGVAPPARSWAGQRTGRPTRGQVLKLFGSWREFCAAGGVRPAEDETRERAEEVERALGLTPPSGSGPPWRQAQRAERMLRIGEQLENGELTIRRASEEDIARWAQERAEREAPPEPEEPDDGSDLEDPPEVPLDDHAALDEEPDEALAGAEL